MKKSVFLLMISIFARMEIRAQTDSINFPVSLSSFEAGSLNNYTRLKWKTACYISYANFQVQKSLNGTTFFTINSFIADRLRCQQPFIFIDSTGNNSEIIYYRLNAGDIDGRFYHSKLVKVSRRQTYFEILSVHPTVTTSNCIMVLSSPSDGTIKLELTNSMGRVTKQFHLNVKRGVSEISVDFGSVSKGSYWLTLADARAIQQNVVVIRQ